jgi:hypothetical protein
MQMQKVIPTSPKIIVPMILIVACTYWITLFIKRLQLFKKTCTSNIGHSKVYFDDSIRYIVQKLLLQFK